MSIETIDCETVDEFWETIAPIGRRIGTPYSNFIYRGQSDSAWELVPRVYRSSVLAKYKRGMMSVLKDHPEQVCFEWFLLNSFLGYCDSSGLSVPGDSVEFREYFTIANIMQMNGISDEHWPQQRVHQLMALAQHHGIPTRLLDWSGNPLVAAYFAASPVIRSEDSQRDKRLAVFAFDISKVRPTEYDLRFVRVPGNTSPNSAFQRSSFVLVGSGGYRGQLFEPDASLESRLVQREGGGCAYTILYKITLPQAFASDILARCERFGVSAATVFPGYDGAAKAVLESMLAPKSGQK